MAKAPKKKEAKQEDKKKQRYKREQEDGIEEEQEDNPLYGVSFGDAIKKITKDDDKQESKKQP